MQRSNQHVSPAGVRQRQAGGGKALHLRSCAFRVVERLESRLLLTTAVASPILGLEPAGGAGPDANGLSAPLSTSKTPAQLRGEYGLGQYGSSTVTFNGVQGTGAGQTIAIIDAYNDPNAASDLHKFDLAMGLPDPPVFEKVNEYGSQTQSSLPTTDPGGPDNANGTWEEEESLDIEYSHAMAPLANIILVECASDSYSDLIQEGVNWARYQPGVSVITMSFGGGEWSGETSLDQYFTTPPGHQGITFLASSGDTGGEVEYPSASPNVVAVGGTTLAPAGTAGSFSNIVGTGTTATITASNNFTTGNTVTIAGITGAGAVFNGTVTITSASSTTFSFASSSVVSSQTPSGTGAAVNDAWGSETGWSDGGGGISQYETAPSYQIGVVSNSLSGGKRTVPDVSAEADPNAPGVAVYDSWDFGSSTPWFDGYFGGTSLSSPMWAGLIAVANQGRAANSLPTFNGPTELLPALYALSGSTSGSNADFHDITSGYNGYEAGSGYDLVTGIGSPVANNLIPALISTDTAPQITSFTVTPDPDNSSASNINAGPVFSVAATNSPTQVQYYLETDYTPGLQTGSGGDTLMATITNPAGGFAFNLGGYGALPNGNYVFYAVAKNSFGYSQTAVADSTYTAGTGTAPTIGSLTATASPVAGTSVTLTAGTFNDTQGTIDYVNFWRESNGVAGLQVGPGGDTLVGDSISPSNSSSPNAGTFSVITTAPTVAGNYTYYAQTSDNNSNAGIASIDGTSARSVTETVVAGSAEQTAFLVPPANTFAGMTLAPLEVEIEDQYGNLCTSNTSSVTLTLNGGSFTSGSTKTVSASGGIATFSNLSITTPGSYTITASDGSLATSTSPSFTISPSAELSAMVTANGATSTTPGQVVSFTVTIANGGQVGVNGATVSDLTPADVLADTYTATDNGQGATGYTASGSGNISDTVNLPTGAIITYTFVCTVNPLATGSLTDTASVSTPSGTVNGLANDGTQTNQGSDTLTLTPTADAYVAITGSDPLDVGSLDVYTIVVTNNGPSAITGTPGSTGLTVADTFPSTLTGVTYSSQVLYGTAAGNSQGTSPSNSLALDDVLTMSSGAIVQYTVTGTVASGAPSTLSDTVTVTDPTGTTDPNLSDNTSTVSATVSGTPTASVVDRTVFYADSYFDSDNTSAPTTADFDAIAPDKTPLMPGQTATFNNYTGYSNGINGIFVDIAGDANFNNIIASDFNFTVGNTSTPGTGSSPGSGWSTLGTAPTLTYFPAMGVDGSSRIGLSWPNGTIAGTWLQVTVLADTDTGLTTPDVFYFGNAPGSDGNTTANARVTSADEVDARDDPHGFANRASICDPNDYDRDTFVNASDEVIARNNQTGFSNALALINLSSSMGNGNNIVSAPAGASQAQTQDVSAAAVSNAVSTATVSSAVSAAPSTAAGSNTGAIVSSTALVSRVPATKAPPGALAAIPSAISAFEAAGDDQSTVVVSPLRNRLKSLVGLISRLQ